MNDDMRDFLQENFDATNNYINSGLASQAVLINMNNSQLKDSIENMGNTLRTSVNDAKNELANRADTNTEIVVQKINSANSSPGNKKPAKQKIQSGSSSGNKKPLPTNRKPRPVTTGKNKSGKKKIKSGKKKIKSGKKKIKSGNATTSKNKNDLKVTRYMVIK